MLSGDRVVYLLDFDNTLFDNDRFAEDLGDRIERGLGAPARARYKALYGELREQWGYADYLATLQQFRNELDGDQELELLEISDFILEYPVGQGLYPGALGVIAHLGARGVPVVLSDGDVVLQPRKIRRSGVEAAVDGRVLVYLHKDKRLDAVKRRYPASHYVAVDDKPHLLAAMKRVLGDELTTIFVRQGHYAAESVGQTIDPPPDQTFERIGDLLKEHP